MDDDRTFWLCVRVKRSVEDTSQPKGFYKDQVYFKGAVEILKMRDQIDFMKLHAVKISKEDTFKLEQ